MGNKKLNRKVSYPSIRLALGVAVTLSVLPAFFLMVWTSLEHSRYIAEHDREAAIRQVEAFAELQTQMTESTRNLLMALTSLPGFRAGDNKHVQEMLTVLLPRNTNYLNLTLTDTKGGVLASSRLSVGTDVSDRYHIREAVKGECFIVGEYILNKIDGTPSLSYTFPVFDLDGKLSGTLTSTVGLTSYNRLFDTMKLPENSILGLLDRNGERLFFYPLKPTNPLGGRIKQSVWDGILLGADSGVLIDRGSDGISRFYTFKKLRLSKTEDPYMYVVYAIPSQLVYGPSQTILAINLIIMAAAACLIILIAMFSSRKLFGQRLDSIVATVNSINSGDLSARLNFLNDTSDLGRIATALDQMTDTVERRTIEQANATRLLSENLMEKELLLKEIHHRVKNNLQLILSLLALQENTAENSSEFKNVMENRIRAMAMVHEMLNESTDMHRIDLGDYTQQLVQLNVHTSKIRLSTQVDATLVLCDLEKAISYGLMVTDLITTTIKYAFNNTNEGKLIISLNTSEGQARLSLLYEGDTLLSDALVSESANLGFRIIQALVSQLKGSLAWERSQGITFTVVFPLS